MNLKAIQSVTHEDVLDVVRTALRGRVRPAVVAEFVASVDWSGSTPEMVEAGIASNIGELEGCLTEWQEGDLAIAGLEARLLALLPEEERQQRLIVAPNSREVTATGLLDYSAAGRPPRNGPDPRDHQVVA